jgi:hypothetical protein
MQPLTVRRTKQARPKTPIRFIMAVTPLDTLCGMVQFYGAITIYFFRGHPGLQRGGACGYFPDFHRVLIERALLLMVSPINQSPNQPVTAA